MTFAADMSPDGRFTLASVRAVFLVNGIAAASWAPLVPAAKTALGLGEADLGLTLLFGGFGTLIGMPTVTAAMMRLGCEATTLIGSMILAVVLSTMMSPMIAIPAVSTLGCVGFLVGPASIGFVAERLGVPGALFCVAILYSSVVLGARRAIPRPSR